MHSSSATKPVRVDLLDVFTERAWARAYLWHCGEFDLHEAVDALQDDAERDGLIERVGQDAVQAILTDSFRAFRERAL